MDACRENRRGMADELKKYSKVFTALGDETRQQILVTFLEYGKEAMRVPEITEHTHLSRPAVSHHLRILKDAGLISMQRRGTMNFYYIDAASGCWEGLRTFVNGAADLVSRANASGYPSIQDDEQEE